MNDENFLQMMLLEETEKEKRFYQRKENKKRIKEENKRRKEKIFTIVFSLIVAALTMYLLFCWIAFDKLVWIF